VHSADVLLAALGDLGGEGPIEISHPEEWLLGGAPVPEHEISIAAVEMGAHFSVAPTASALASALLELDREARRTATAIRRRVSTAELFGRGRRLEPLKDGLVVQEARAGSLDVTLALGGLYTIVTSQPLSFMLNLASLAGYGRVVVRVLTPGGRERAHRLSVAPTGPPPPAAPGDAAMRVPTPDGDIVVPARFTYVKLHARGADGSIIDIEAES
jgi:hypothetical protein